MRCPNCEYETDYDFKYCPECGADTREQPAQDQNEQETLQARRLAYVREDYNPARDGRPVPADLGQQVSAEKKPPTTGMIIFSLVNMLCCGFGISMVLGIIALVFTILSTSEPTWGKAAQKLATARILNIIGLVFVVIQVIVFFVLVISVLIFSANTGYSTW